MPYKVSDAEKLAERASPLKELDGDLAATLRCLVGAGALLVRHLAHTGGHCTLTLGHFSGWGMAR